MKQDMLYVVLALVAVCSLCIGAFIGYWYQEFRYEERESSWAKKLKKARQRNKELREATPFVR